MIWWYRQESRWRNSHESQFIMAPYKTATFWEFVIAIYLLSLRCIYRRTNLTCFLGGWPEPFTNNTRWVLLQVAHVYTFLGFWFWSHGSDTVGSKDICNLWPATLQRCKLDHHIILLMDEILHRLVCIKPCKEWDKLPINYQDFLEMFYGLIQVPPPLRSLYMVHTIGISWRFLPTETRETLPQVHSMYGIFTYIHHKF